MKKKFLLLLAVTVFCLLVALPAMAADVFVFTEKTISLFEGETFATVLTRDGKFAENGEIEYSSDNQKVATVTADGTVTAIAKGRAKITATLKQNGRKVIYSTAEIRVARRVTKVTLSQKNLTMYMPDDPVLEGVLVPATDGGEALNQPVIVLALGKWLSLNAVCTPEDASNRKVSYATSDVGVAKINGENTLKPVEKGECELIISSVQNPEITETFHVLVIDPVKKIKIEAPVKTIFIGQTMSMDPVFTPDTASIRKVTWNSRRPQVATVDENGVVTAVSKGQATIEAKALDGSGVTGVLTINVAQEVTEVSLKEPEATLPVKRQLRVNATALPKEADNRRLTWESSDESIATVRNGEVTAKKAGTCEIYAISESNPSVRAAFHLTVVQPVTKISFTTPAGLSFPIMTSQRLEWAVEPADATIKDVTFKSNQPKIATVDAEGVVTGLSKGSATITVTAADGSKRYANYRVNITQPVEGVKLTRDVYYVQRDPYRGTNIRATILPKEANNQKVYWEIGDDYVASVRSNGTSTGRVTGLENGTTTVTAITEDGGFVATASIQVADYDGAIFVESLQITEDNKIRLSLLNLSPFTIDTVYLRVDCYDTQNQPMIYNRDGVSTGFDASYPLPLMPGERSVHGQFNFGNFLDTGTLGAVIVTVTGYKFDNGQTWDIPEEYRIPSQPYYSQHMWEPTPTPLPPTDSAVEGASNG